MTIKEVSQKYDIPQATLRYYERVGLIPPVPRTEGGIRNYGAKDLSWIEMTLCMRSAGVPVETLIEYNHLYQMGDATFAARRDLLQDQLDTLEEQKQQLETTIARLQYKISRYNEALQTGVLRWGNGDCEKK